MFAFIWQYTVNDSRKPEFLSAYGPDGSWVQLFSRDSDYLGTKLFHDIENNDRYVTIDYWVSMEARDSFRKRYSTEFTSLDEMCEEYTLSEEFLGDFESHDESAA